MRTPTKLVLDTNVVLDWLVFEDPVLHPLRLRLGEGLVVALTDTRASGELARVLAYPNFNLDAAQQAAVMAAYRAQSTTVDVAGESLPQRFPGCRDRDDDHFLALAYRTRAALVSRDKEVLALRVRMARFGVTVLDVPGLLWLLEAPAGRVVNVDTDS